MRKLRFSAKLERFDTEGDDDDSLRGVWIGVVVVEDMAEVEVDRDCGLITGERRACDGEEGDKALPGSAIMLMNLWNWRSYRSSLRWHASSWKVHCWRLRPAGVFPKPATLCLGVCLEDANGYYLIPCGQ